MRTYWTGRMKRKERGDSKEVETVQFLHLLNSAASILYVGKQLSSYDLLDMASSESEDDSELTALLHQKVIQVK